MPLKAQQAIMEFLQVGFFEKPKHS